MQSSHNVDLVIQYALLVASHEDDYYERDLGPIHFIKYVYLADMDFAKFNDGKTFTGIDWTFYKFGPWSVDVNNQIEPALLSLGAKKKNIPSQFCNEDFIRWEIPPDESMTASIKKQLPMEVWCSIGSNVHKYKSNTPALLHFVYATPPLLNAAPGEHLDFGVMLSFEPDDGSEEEFVPLLERISKKKRRLFKEKMLELKTQLNEEAKKQKRNRFTPDYDTVFEEGVTWLDSLGGAPFPSEGADVEFADEIWKSEARRGHA